MLPRTALQLRVDRAQFAPTRWLAQFPLPNLRDLLHFRRWEKQCRQAIDTCDLLGLHCISVSIPLERQGTIHGITVLEPRADVEFSIEFVRVLALISHVLQS